MIYKGVIDFEVAFHISM